VVDSKDIDNPDYVRARHRRAKIVSITSLALAGVGFLVATVVIFGFGRRLTDLGKTHEVPTAQLANAIVLFAVLTVVFAMQLVSNALVLIFFTRLDRRRLASTSNSPRP
jgi:hypothetical protein